jgi:hypothetical protein
MPTAVYDSIDFTISSSPSPAQDCAADDSMRGWGKKGAKETGIKTNKHNTYEIICGTVKRRCARSRFRPTFGDDCRKLMEMYE